MNTRETFGDQREQDSSQVKALAIDTARALQLSQYRLRNPTHAVTPHLPDQPSSSFQPEPGNPSTGILTPVPLQDQGLRQHKQTPPYDDFNFTVEQKQQFLQQPPFSSESQLVPRLAICSLIMSPSWWPIPLPPVYSPTPGKKAVKLHIEDRGQLSKAGSSLPLCRF